MRTEIYQMYKFVITVDYVVTVDYHSSNFWDFKIGEGKGGFENFKIKGTFSGHAT